MIDPDDPPRWWTVDEANAVRPRVIEVVERAQTAAVELARRSADLAEQAVGNGHAPPTEEAVIFHTAIAELEVDGIVLRDVRQGLVDFPARAPDGRGYWLCWLTTEPEVAWWHWPEDGFAGRTPLSTPPR
ncbi:MAG TPA: DUF2203 domain-containing protein [Acidimicrobiales bacterium]|jgi:hypothetical protein